MTSALGARPSAIVFSFLIGLANMYGVTAGAAHANDELPHVRYEVSGPGVAETLTFQLDTGQRHQVNVPLPWSTEFTAFGGQVFVLSAQAEGAVTCRILINGNVVSNNTAKGAPAHTVCSN
jgi:Mycobacterium membrane protein